jgi:hypothetical protein
LRNFAATFRAVLAIDFHLNVIIYWSVVGVQHGVSYYRKFVEGESVAAQLQLRSGSDRIEIQPERLTAGDTGLR